MNERTPVVLTRVLAVTLALGCAVGVAVSAPVTTAASSIALVAMSALVAHSAWRHSRLTRALATGSRPGTIDGVAVRWRPLASHAGVAGLRRPTIYCDPELTHRLTSDELRAVALHEHGHQQRRDPLRLVVLAALHPVVRRLPGGPAWFERRRAELEIRADRHALDQGATRPELVRALLELGNGGAHDAVPGFASAVELRLRALVELGAAPPAGSRWATRLLAGTAIVAVCALAVTHHRLMGPGGLGCVLAGC